MKILIVDDDIFNRDGLRIYLEGLGDTVLDAGNRKMAWDIVQKEHPDVALIDIVIPDQASEKVIRGSSYGIELARQIKVQFPSLGVVLFSAFETHGGSILDLITRGVRGIAYKLKGTSPLSLRNAIYAVRDGQVVIDPEVSNSQSFTDALLKQLSPEEKPWVLRATELIGNLSARNLDIGRRVAASHTRSFIAQELNLSIKTVDNYITQLYENLDLNDTDSGGTGFAINKAIVLAKAFMLYELVNQ